ncbi:hypothetical protein F5Y17DRAFT_270151 [Xylariaceae sp. FL0594]|nr:hypothetical protein F5Y17DRAFT_270151 [Xylariaceae sp. FL0594]
MGQPRSESVCWTCRARRKRCDGERPCCGTCCRLEISCAGFDASPPHWMDGGVLQKAYSKELKGLIKKRRRRSSSTQELSQLAHVTNAPSSLSIDFTSSLDHGTQLATFDFSDACFDVSGLGTDLTQAPLDLDFVVGECNVSLLPSDLPATPTDETDKSPLAEPCPGSPRSTETPASSNTPPGNWQAPPPLPTITESGEGSELEGPFLGVKAGDWSVIAHYLHSVWYRMFPFLCRDQ